MLSVSPSLGPASPPASLPVSAAVDWQEARDLSVLLSPFLHEPVRVCDIGAAETGPNVINTGILLGGYGGDLVFRVMGATLCQTSSSPRLSL